MSNTLEQISEAPDTYDADGKSDMDAQGKGSSKANPTGVRAKKQGPADRGGSPESMSSVLSSVVPGQSGMKEAVAELFDGQDLSEDFMLKAETIFEAAINQKVSNIREELETEFAERFEEELEVAVNELVEKIDEYLQYATSHYMQENALAIDNGIHVQMAESFMNGLHNLYVEHNISVEDEQIDLVAEMSQEIETLEAKLNEAVNREIALASELNEAKAADIFARVADDLTVSETEKFADLVETFETNDLGVFKTKLEIIKERHFDSKKKVLSESFDEEPIDVIERVVSDPTIAAIAAAISKSAKK